MPRASATLHRFSIATPCRNALAPLKRCIGSVRGQEGVEFEHLVQDALSTDGTPEWLAAQQRSGARGLSAVSRADSGMYDAIEAAWSRGGGSIFSWLNADEQYLPGTLAAVAAYFDRHPRADAVFGNYIVADPSGRPLAVRREIPVRKAYVVNHMLNAVSCTLFFRRRLRDRGLLTLDTRYRYTADTALVLGLLDAGVRIHHLPRYLSVFGVDGTNLSTLPAAQAESEALRLARGAFRWRWCRESVLAGRRIERALHGAYRTEKVCYHYAVDETPRYVEVTAPAVGGRYTLSDEPGDGAVLTPVETRRDPSREYPWTLQRTSSSTASGLSTPTPAAPVVSRTFER